MNKYISSILIIFFSILIIGCNTANVQDNSHKAHPIDRGLDSIKSIGTLKALINYSATSYFLYKGNPMGFEYELLKKYAAHIGVDLEVIPIKNMDSVFVNLNNGKGDIAAANFTVTQERLHRVDFTNPIIATKQVLIQRKPANWKVLNKKNLKDSLLQESYDLIGKTVVVRKGSSFYSRLKSLSNEVGGKIKIKTVDGDISMEQLIGFVAEGKIDFTIGDKNIAKVSQWRYPNINIDMPISLNQRIAWATRSNADSLIVSLNSWLADFQKTRSFKILYKKYFSSEHSFNKRINNEYYTLTSGQISPYDSLFKEYAPVVNWEWELLAAMVYQESHFNNKARGWGGSFGLMQFMPQTGANFGVDSNSVPAANVKAGVNYIKKLNYIWMDQIEDSLERTKFVLASYNVGPGHVIDAKNLAVKYGKDPTKWENVGYYLLHKSEPKYYKDDVVKHGYCKGYIVYDYVNEIMERYQHYLQITKEQELATK
jgi:membrane-bound lytic murein transglycosylase F